MQKSLLLLFLMPLWGTAFADTAINYQASEAQIRAGITTPNMAVSGDGKTLVVVDDVRKTLVLLDADLNVLKIHDVKSKDGKASSRVSVVCDAAPRQSFVVALKDLPEVWEVSYNPKAEPIAAGLVHDYQYKEGAFIPAYLNPRRTMLAEPLDNFYFSPNFAQLMGTSHHAAKGQVVNLDVRQKIADFELPAIPHPGCGKPRSDRTFQLQ